MALERSLPSRIAALAAAVEGASVSASDASLLASLATVGELRRAVDALGAQLAHEVTVRSAGDDSLSRRQGERSPELLVARTAGIDPVEAGTWCAVGATGAPRVSLLGELLPAAFPALAESISAGAMMAASARVLAETLDTISGTIDMDELAAIERILVDVTPSLALREVRRLCAQAIDRADPDGTEPREEELRRHTGVKVKTRRDGLIEWIAVMLPEHAGFLTAAVDARTAPRRQPTFTEDQAEIDMMADERTLPQSRLDALVSIARDSLRYDDGDVAGTAVTMVVTMTLEALQTGIGQAFIEGVDTPLSAAAARRLACDAEIIPAVLGGNSEPLDLGHASRLFNRAQRRLIAFRDKCCIWPGCTAPPGWCEIAHILAWQHGGKTDVKNGVLLCPFHHRRFDQDGWQLHTEGTTRYLIPPPWVDASRTPRRAGRPELSSVS